MRQRAWKMGERGGATGAWGSLPCSRARGIWDGERQGGRRACARTPGVLEERDFFPFGESTQRGFEGLRVER